MKLYLVQHGDALSKTINPKRPLSDQGHQDVQKMAQFLKQSDVKVEQVIHSGKLRARQTADYLSKNMAIGKTLQINDKINPNDSPQCIAQNIMTWECDSLIVGHLPFMAKLVSYLVLGSDESAVVAFQPGTVVCIQRDEEQKWQINWMITPELLTD
jgi:phosphohistidine phosphatase